LTLAGSVNPENPASVALNIFDQLRLRKPLAESFASLGFEGESAWRAAARIKVLLLAQLETAKQQPAHAAPEQTSAEPIEPESNEKLGSRAELTSTLEPVSSHKPVPTRKPVLAPMVAGLPRALWSDPDVRWLTGVHDAGEYSYLVQEPFEELLWWLQMPVILQLASKTALVKADTHSFCSGIQESIAEAERAGYKLQTLLGNAEEEQEIVVPEPKKSEEHTESSDDAEQTTPGRAPAERSL